MSKITIANILKESKNFISYLPELYTNVVNWEDRLPQFLVAFYVFFLTICIIFHKHIAVGLIVIFFALFAAGFTQYINTMGGWYQHEMKEIIIFNKPLISKLYFDESGYFILGMWTLPIFLISIITAILVMINLVRQIRYYTNQVVDEKNHKEEENKEEEEEEEEEKKEEEKTEVEKAKSADKTKKD